jgi:hypothetical protein
MSYTQADLDAIEKAIKGGERRVRLQDKEVEYRTLAEMFAIRNKIATEVAGKTLGMKRVNMVTDKGLI